MNQDQDPTLSSPNILHNQAREFELSQAVAGDIEGDFHFPSVILDQDSLGKSEINVGCYGGEYYLAHPGAKVESLVAAERGDAVLIKELPLPIGKEAGTKLTLGREGVEMTDPDGRKHIMNPDTSIVKRFTELFGKSVSRRHISFEITKKGIRYIDHSLNGTEISQTNASSERESKISGSNATEGLGKGALSSTTRMEIVNALPEI